jgi:hypothetical protein
MYNVTFLVTIDSYSSSKISDLSLMKEKIVMGRDIPLKVIR